MFAVTRSVIPLAFLPEGAQGIVQGIRGGMNARRRLYELGLTEGAFIRVIRSMGRGPIVVEVRGSRIALGRGLSMKIMVEVVG
jgi:ferrous iron transport protein A